MKKRMIDPKFFSDTELAEALDFAGRLFYIGLWCEAEDSGVFVPNLRDLRNRIFSVHEVPEGHDVTLRQVESYYAVLTSPGLRKVVEYEKDGRRFAWVRNFHVWQTLVNPTAPKLPLPDWLLWRNYNKPGEDKRSQYKYEVLDYDFSVDPPRPRQAARPEPVRPPAREPFPKSAPALVPKARFRDAVSGIQEGKGGDGR